MNTEQKQYLYPTAKQNNGQILQGSLHSPETLSLYAKKTSSLCTSNCNETETHCSPISHVLSSNYTRAEETVISHAMPNVSSQHRDATLSVSSITAQPLFFVHETKAHKALPFKRLIWTLIKHLSFFLKELAWKRNIRRGHTRKLTPSYPLG